MTDMAWLFGLVTGTLLSIALDVMLFGSIAAVPLAALVYLSVISNGTAIVVLVGIAVILTVYHLFVATLKALGKR